MSLTPLLVAIQSFLDNELTFEVQRSEAPDIDPPYGRWDVLDKHRDETQENYADEEYGQSLWITVDCWGETGVEAAEAFDELATTFKVTSILPTGMRLFRRPALEFSRPLKDPDTNLHRVTSRWKLQFTTL